MIQLDNNVFFRLDIGNLEDLATTSNIVDFTIVEQLGNNLPAAVLQFDLSTELQDVLSHELVNVEVTIGFSEEDSLLSRWQVAGFKKVKNALVLTLTLNRDYVNVSKIKAFKGMDSTSVIKEIASETFADILWGESKTEVSSIDVNNFNDKMDWLQCWQSDREFIDELYLHSYKAGSLLVPGIISSIYGGSNEKYGTFRLVDIYKRDNIVELKRDPSTGELDDDGQPVQKLSFLDDTMYMSASALYNYQAGVKRLTQFVIDEATNVDEGVDTDPIFSGVFNAAKQLGEDTKLSVREYSSPTRFLSDNVHSNYHKAAKLNLNRLSKFGGASKVLYVADRRGITIGDFIRVHSLIPGTTTVAPIESGDYLVAGVITKVVSNQAKRTFGKNLILRRDAVDIMEWDGLFKELD